MSSYASLFECSIESEDSSTDSSFDDCLHSRIVLGSPQLVNGQPVWPRHWGITREQVQELLERLRQDPDWDSSNNVYTLVRDFIIPWTAGSGLGYALHLNQQHPKAMTVFVSHWMGEIAEDFLETVVRATSPGEGIYICALANYQAEDGAGPSLSEQLGNHPKSSPFRQVLKDLQRQRQTYGWQCRWRALFELLPWPLLCIGLAVLCVPRILFDGWPHLYLQLIMCVCFCVASWLASRWLAWTAPLYAQRMLVVPTSRGDIYARLWVVYEIFTATSLSLPVRLAPTMARAGKVSSRHAVCSFKPDADRIRAEIENSGSNFSAIDESVHRVVSQSRWYTGCLIIKYCAIVIFPGMLWERIHANDVAVHHFYGIPLYQSLMICLFYWLARKANGIFHINEGITIACTLIVLSHRIYAVIMEMQLNTPVFNQDHQIRRLLEVCLWDVANIASMLLATILWPFPSCLSSQYRNRVMSIAFLALACLIYFEDRHSYDTISTHKPNLGMSRTDRIAEVLSGAWMSLTSIYMCWTECSRLGIKFQNCLQHPRLVGILTWAWCIIWVPVLPVNDFLDYACRYAWRMSRT